MIVKAPPPVFESATTHVEAPDEPVPLTGPQVRDVTAALPPTASGVDREVPLNDAVMVAVWSVAAADTLAVNVVEVAFGATETEAGTVTDALVLESVTVPPPVFDMAIVHVLDWEAAHAGRAASHRGDGQWANERERHGSRHAIQGSRNADGYLRRGRPPSP
jgi:hypothetical protein